LVNLSENAMHVFKTLYSREEENVEDTFKRVANVFGNNKEEVDIAYNLQLNNIWRPNTPVYFNSGKKPFIASACFVVGLNDSMSSIYDIANVSRKIFQEGCGVGIPIGNLREKDAPIFEGGGVPIGKSSGAITFMKLFDAVGETTKSGGRVRRAAILCSLPVWHPDIIPFINCKKEDGQLSNMNISVSITDNFIDCLENNIPFSIHTPYDGSRKRLEDPNIIWENIVRNSHSTAEPGVIFIDTVNKWNPLKKISLIECSNPCGEQFLTPFNCCNLSMININKFVKWKGEKYKSEVLFDWEELYDVSKKVMFLMDNLIDKMDFPDNRFKENNLKFRQIGIGIAGLADTFYTLDLKYNSQTGRDFAEEVYRIITSACVEASTELAEKNGTFVDYDVVKEDIEQIIEKHITPEDGIDAKTKYILERVKKFGLRNCQFTTAQPTGTTALSCDASYGIEPCFGLVFQKNLMSGETMNIVNPIFKERFKNESWYNEELIEKILVNKGSLKNLRGIPKDVRDVFIVAYDIKPSDRVELQAAIQKRISTAVSSTVNLPSDIPKEEISEIFKLAYKRGLKGITIYRDGSRKGQPVTFKETKSGDVIVQSNVELPSMLDGKRYKIDFGDKKLYTQINKLENMPVEIFLTLGNQDQEINGLLECIGKLLSVSLQHRVPLEKMTKQMKDISSNYPVWHRFSEEDKKPCHIQSIPDGVATILERFYTNGESDTDKITGAEYCPKCNSKSYLMVEGCSTCQSCGFSKCS
jgi:ribonucleoside-diphosphate reductase alpha chain